MENKPVMWAKPNMPSQMGYAFLFKDGFVAIALIPYIQWQRKVPRLVVERELYLHVEKLKRVRDEMDARHARLDEDPTRP